MPYRTTTFLPRNWYHIYNRGNHREKVFFEDDNYRYFLFQFQKHLPPDQVSLLAYCLLPNHFHFVVELTTGCDVSRLMKNLIISYTKSINLRYNMVGHLFQGRFQCKHVDTEEYLLNVTRYVHNNPAKAMLVQSNELWEFSSYGVYLGKKRNPTVNTARVMQHFTGIEDFKRFSEAMTHKEYAKMRDG